MNADSVPGEDTSRSSDAPEVEKIFHALELIHNPSSSNDIRQNASHYLENIKTNEAAPYIGHQLLSDHSLPPTARYYGASLLKHSIQHRWMQNSEEQNREIKQLILSLSQQLQDRDPQFVCNKIAELWVDVAKRSWAISWMNMDDDLVDLWNRSSLHKAYVLVILEALSEDIFGNEDPAAGVRGTDLNKACVEIFTSEQALQESFPHRETNTRLRSGQQGWLVRSCEFLDYCMKEDSHHEARNLIDKTLGLLKSLMLWMNPKAISASNATERLMQCLKISFTSIQTEAIDTLHILYSRSNFRAGDLTDLLRPPLEADGVRLLRNLYQWTMIDSADADTDKYLLGKKLSEMLYNLSGLLRHHPDQVPDSCDLEAFFELLAEVLRSPSLQISIPILHLWTQIFCSPVYKTAPTVIRLSGPLLELCSDRLIRYESFPGSTVDPIVRILDTDFDTIPEKHAFLGNYHRFCNNLIELIVEFHSTDALPYLLKRTTARMDQFIRAQTSTMLSQEYSKSSLPLLRLDADFSAIEAALRGFMRTTQNADGSENHQNLEHFIPVLSQWCRRLMGVQFQDPLACERAMHLVLAFGAGPLKRDSSFAIESFYYIVRAHYETKPGCLAYNSAVEDLRGFCQHQIQRLAMRFPDFLAGDYQNIEKEVSSTFEMHQSDEAARMRLLAVLFIIKHRAKHTDQAAIEPQLQGFLQPLLHAWQKEETSQSVASFENFCEMMGLKGIHQYFLHRNAHNLDDWTSHPLDTEGEAFQDRIQHVLAEIPLRSTKIILGVSIEKLRPGSPQYEMAARLWQHNIPVVLPNLLKFISQAQAFHNPENWDLPADLHGLVTRMLTDRFWQVGISNESRDDFYAKVDSSKKTLEGLASSVRSTIRSIRESAYRVIFYFSQLGEHFYSYQELPKPLSEALFRDAGFLSLHQMAMLIEMVKAVIEHCPPSCRAHFLPSVTAACFARLDQRLSLEWAKVEQRQGSNFDEDNLSQEMKDESILRQLMFAVVGMINGLVGPSKPPHAKNSASDASTPAKAIEPPSSSIREFALQTPDVLQPILTFCCHAIRMHDTRSCQSIANILISLIPDFTDSSSLHVDVREFLSSEVLKSCITSVNDAYFVDAQRDLAMLVASIVATYSPMTNTARNILCSLPSTTETKVDHLLIQLNNTRANHRQQRALVLVFLENIRGVSVSEQGKVGKPDTRKIRSAAMQERYMTVEIMPKAERQPSPDLAGISTMFG